jgi:hypothetical protein
VLKFLKERGLFRKDKTQTTKNLGSPEKGVGSVIRRSAKNVWMLGGSGCGGSYDVSLNI